MPTLTQTVTLLASILALTGCTSIAPVPAGTLPITLSGVEERTAALGLKVTFPAGEYLPDFAGEDGTYYVAPTSVIFRSLGVNSPFRGGIFVPSPNAKDQRQAAWSYGRGDVVGGGIFANGDSSIHKYRYELPIAFTKNGPNQSPEPTAPSGRGSS